MPGHEIPQRYFDWLRRRDGRLMEDVFRHNRLDIVSMASLLKHLTDLVEGSHECPMPITATFCRLQGCITTAGDLAVGQADA